MKISPAKINKVLVIAVSCLGDMLLATAALQNLKMYLPNAKFVIYARTEIIDLFQDDPMWDEIHKYDKDRPNSIYFGMCGRIAAIKEFRAGHYDLVIDLRSTLVPLLCNAQYAPLWGWRELFLSKKMHEAERNINCMATLGVPIYTRNLRLYVPANIMHSVLESLGNDANHLIVINPGASIESKTWHIDNFVTLSNMLTSHGFTIGVIGYKGKEQEYAHQIIKNIHGRVLDFSGKIPLVISAARISLAKLFITNDTGALHIASALNVPTVSIFGSTDPARYGSWNCKHEALITKLPCWPCKCLGGQCPMQEPYQCKCIRSITPQQVFNAVTRLLPEILLKPTSC